MAPLYPCKTIARLFNLTERRIQQLASEGIIPKSERGKYDLVECVRGYIKFLQDRAFGKELSALDSHTERTRLLKAQADIAELECEQMRGTLIDCEVIQEHWCMQDGAMKTKIMGLPTKVAHVVQNATTMVEIENAINRECVEALQELRNAIPERPADIILRAEGNAEATAEADDKPVGGSKPPAKSRGKRRAGAVAH